MGLREKLKPNENRQPEQTPVAVIQPVAIVPPAAVRTTTDCPHRQTRIVAIVPPEAFDFDPSEQHHLIIDRTNEDWWERFEECSWCGEWLDCVDDNPIKSESKIIEEAKPSAVAGFEW